MWNLATAPAWSDLIHITLWRNDGFLHLFYNFSKNNAFGKNLIRMKFIVHEISFKWVYFWAVKPNGYFVHFFVKSFPNIEFKNFYLVIILKFFLSNIHIINFEIPKIFWRRTPNLMKNFLKISLTLHWIFL